MYYFTVLMLKILPSGIFALSISSATTLMSIIQIGESRMSASFFTNAIAETHCTSNFLRSGKGRFISRFTF